MLEILLFLLFLGVYGFGMVWVGYGVAAHKYLITADVQRMDTQEFIGIVELPFVPTLLEIDGRLWFVHGTKSDGENTVLYVRLQDQ